ncbi:hypothetical protein [Blastococcus sp. TF02A-26]|uniref:hypothetical protein n=1 Tax=Blastococcus sp. TF02A-26 TaxID=2250577 RepID=UPI000DE84375|nr:hypothetical protein [Blastococcus sp. TF02A-26]RBY85372.1 hypothetical protein DQ240_12385 [Blastococcus sp. TF02A-26]
MSTPEPTVAPARPHPAFSALVGLTTLGVLLQGLWAGLFLGTDDYGTWVSVHQHAGEATIVLALLSTVAAAVWMRHRRPVVIATAALFVLLLAEYFLGYFGDDTRGLIVVHVPLAMLLMALAVYLPVMARRS